MSSIQKYDFSKLIDQEDVDKAIETIDFLFEMDGWVEGYPTFQTRPYLFEQQNFYKFECSFIFSCFSYLKREVCVTDVKSWCYMDYYDNWKLKDHNSLWHVHNDRGNNMLSGVFYLSVPQGNDVPSTEFKTQNDILFEKFSWFIFSSDDLHRPGKITSNEKRYVLSADFYYE